MEDVEYLIDGVNLKEYGVEVVSSTGLVDGLEMKEPLSVDWADYHGEVVKLTSPRYKSREISLDCYIVADNNDDFVARISALMGVLQSTGLRRLECFPSNSEKPLVYDVYLVDKVEVEKTWNDEPMVGTFTITFIEPSPVKRVIKHTATSTGYCTINITTTKKIQITWGDNSSICQCYIDGSWVTQSASDNLSGTLQIRHQYSAGTFYVAIHGVIEEITKLTTSGTVVWNRL